MQRVPFLLTILAFAAFHVGVMAAAAPGPVIVPNEVLSTLQALPTNGHVDVAAFPVGTAVGRSMHFERIETYAPNAQIFEIGRDGRHEVVRSQRIHLLGYSDDGQARAVLSFDPEITRVSGSGSGPAGGFELRGELHNGALTIRAIAAEDALPQGVVPQFMSGDDAVPGGHPLPNGLALALAPVPSATPLRSAVVAVDTDNEFMSKRFGNNTAAASDWVGDLVATVNVMYERDLSVRLLQDTTLLRTTTDPYTVGGSGASRAQLDEFGNYWQANYASVPRAFAMLLSGKSSSGHSASGIAWLNAYCRKPSYGGSYSVNQIFTSSGISVSLSANIVGHELGHNFGASHTHCTDATTGASPTGVNTIDQCFAGEAVNGCYSGPQSCPASGPGNPRGTIMSYCNNNGCGQNVQFFHPTHIARLSALVAANTPACLMPYIDAIFANGFE